MHLYNFSMGAEKLCTFYSSCAKCPIYKFQGGGEGYKEAKM